MKLLAASGLFSTLTHFALASNNILLGEGYLYLVGISLGFPRETEIVISGTHEVSGLGEGTLYKVEDGIVKSFDDTYMTVGEDGKFEMCPIEDFASSVPVKVYEYENIIDSDGYMVIESDWSGARNPVDIFWVFNDQLIGSTYGSDSFISKYIVFRKATQNYW